MLQGTGVVLCFGFGPIIIRDKATLATHKTCIGLDINTTVNSTNKVHVGYTLLSLKGILSFDPSVSAAGETCQKPSPDLEIL